jgi:hypothetical protein
MRTLRDYHGAVKAGLHALLLRRSGPQGDEARKEEDEDLNGVATVANLQHVIQWIEQQKLYDL